MVLISSLIFAKNFMKKDVENFKSQFKINSNDDFNNYNDKKTLAGISFITLLFFFTINIIPALVISYQCTKNSDLFKKGLHMTLSFLFSDIYIFLFIFSKFLLKNKSCCPNIIVKG